MRKQIDEAMSAIEGYLNFLIKLERYEEAAIYRDKIKEIKTLLNLL